MGAETRRQNLVYNRGEVCDEQIFLTAYYNENDRFAAAWLRNLIAEGVIAYGEVDERSITEIKAADLAGFTQCHFFAGIGVWNYALRQSGWPDSLGVWTGSCPCQSFSASGKRGGFSDKRHLWPTWGRLIEECRPDVLFGEQVASKDGLAWFDIVSSEMERAGYTIGATDLSAAGVGAPHIRQRLFFVAHADGWKPGDRILQRGGKHGQFAKNGGTRGLADTECDGGRSDEPRRGSQGREADGRDREDGGLADAPSSRQCGAEERRIDRQTKRTRARSGEPERNSSTDKLGNAESGGRGERRDAALPRSSGHVDSAITTYGMGYSRSPGFQGLTRHGDDGNRSGRIDARESGSATAAGPLNGYWRKGIWIPCKDGTLRPTEPTIFPLVDGPSRNRVGLLRGAGNALVAPAAQAFIEAFLEVMR